MAQAKPPDAAPQAAPDPAAVPAPVNTPPVAAAAAAPVEMVQAWVDHERESAPDAHGKTTMIPVHSLQWVPKPKPAE